MSEWEVKQLDGVADRITVKNSAGHQRVLTVAAGHGLVDQETYFNKRVASADLSGYWVVEPGDFVYNKSTSKDAPWGVIARWDGDGPAVVTTLYIVFRAHPNIQSDYLLHACNGKYFFNSLRGTLREGARAHGLLNVRLAEFFGAQLVVPPVDEQRRIVDVMAAVDAQVEALAQEVECAGATLARLNSDVFEMLPVSRTLGDFTATRSGPSYAAADVSPTAGPGAVPVIGIPNTKPDGSFDLSEISHVVGLPDSVGKIDESSLVLIRTNGNRQRIGNVYMPPEAAHGHAVSAFQFLMKVDDPSDREFVYWFLREQSTQAAMSEAASGTTGLGNLAVRWLNAVQMPWSDDPAARAAVVAPLRSLQNAIDMSSQELSHLRTLRSSLLTSLLNQEIEIPESYDALLEEVS